MRYIDGAQTHEAVAFNLMVEVFIAEQNGPRKAQPTRESLLKLYADCINTVRTGEPPEA